MAYQYTNKRGQTYYLHKRDVVLRGSGHKQTIYFFKRNQGENVLDQLPAGYTVVESTRSGLPVLRKK